MITEESVKITEVPVEARFRRGTCEFMMLRKDVYGPVAVCYIGDAHHTPGHKYGFSQDLDVIWFKEDYSWGMNKERSGDAENVVFNKEVKQKRQTNREGLPYESWRGTGD